MLKRGFYRQTAIYATGVGLGASKGKEVGKYQEGYAGYVNMVKDSVSRIELRFHWYIAERFHCRHESDMMVESLRWGAAAFVTCILLYIAY